MLRSKPFTCWFKRHIWREEEDDEQRLSPSYEYKNTFYRRMCDTCSYNIQLVRQVCFSSHGASTVYGTVTSVLLFQHLKIDKNDLKTRSFQVPAIILISHPPVRVITWWQPPHCLMNSKSKCLKAWTGLYPVSRPQKNQGKWPVKSVNNTQDLLHRRGWKRLDYDEARTVFHRSV